MYLWTNGAMDSSLLTTIEASEVLGVSPRRLANLVKQGLIAPVGMPAAPGRPATYDANEVAALAKIREDRLSLAAVAMNAERAIQKVQQLERLVHRLAAVVDLRARTLDLDEDSVRSLHLRVEDEQDALTPPSANDILQWASTFQAIGIEYYQCVEKYLGVEEPWEPYLALAAKLLIEVSRDAYKVSLDMQAAKSALKMAQTSLYQASFLYAQQQKGKHEAYRIFPAAAGDMHQDIVSLGLVIYGMGD